MRRKVHRAEREGVKVVEVDGRMDETVRQRIEERCQDWAAARKGTQIHLTGVRPFDDMIHRKYFYATDKDGQVSTLQRSSYRNSTNRRRADLCPRCPCATLPEARFPNQVGSRIPRGTLGCNRIHPHFCYQEVGRCWCAKCYVRGWGYGDAAARR